MGTKLVGPLYQLQNPAQSGGVAVTVGTRVVSPIVRRKKRIGPSYSHVFGPPAPVVSEVAEPFGTLAHIDAPVPGPIPTDKSAIGGPKPKPVTAEVLLATALGPERETTTGTVIRK